MLSVVVAPAAVGVMVVDPKTTVAPSDMEELRIEIGWLYPFTEVTVTMNCAVVGGGGANILPEPGVASVTVMVYPETATVPEAEWLKVPAVPVNEIALVPGGVRLSCEVMILNGTVLPVAVTVGVP